MSDRFAVIGKPIAHSLSPDIHQAFALQTGRSLTYEKILGDEPTFVQQVSDFFSTGGKGMNVTLPFKEQAFQMAVTASLRATQAGAANTLWWQDNGLHADNTDGIGLVRDLTRHFSLAGKRVVILGAGGAAKGIIAALVDEKIARLTIANRSLSRLETVPSTIDKCLFSELGADYDVVIHATSASLLREAIVLPEDLWQSNPFCYDLSYSLQHATSFVSQAITHHCQAIDGLGMLVEQAAESFWLWHGIKPDTESVLAMLNQSA